MPSKNNLWTRRSTVQALLAFGLGATLGWSEDAQAQSFPNRTIKFISGASPGSASDIIGRAVGEKLQAELGQSVVLENRMGGSGAIAIQAVLSAPADGHTIFVYTSAHTVVPLISKVNYDPIKDFAAVIPLAVVPNVLVVSPSKGYKSVKDLIDAAKAKPGALNYASVGAGSATHMSAEKFRTSVSIDVVHVPYKGSPEAITETIAGGICQ